MKQHDVTATIGANVRAVRTEASLSRKRLAEIADVSERYLNQLEHGDANVSVGVLARIAEALAVDLSSLLPAAGGAPTRGSARRAVHAPLAAIVGAMSLREQEGAIPVLERYIQDRRKSLRGIALLGLRGAGKSTIGGLYAGRHGLPFISVTREIEARAGMTLNDLFNLGGTEAYRALENDVVRSLVGRNDRIVLETAGGIVSNKEALEDIFGAFKTVWLKASPEEHLQRVVRQGDMRPMHGAPKALEQLKTLLALREQDYARADCVINTAGRPVDDCVAELERIAGSVAVAT
jgi:XRE family transcriptional regulator, aerobic/anaerobic benzoate catabolism transcriptional regulator